MAWVNATVDSVMFKNFLDFTKLSCALLKQEDLLKFTVVLFQNLKLEIGLNCLHEWPLKGKIP